MDHDLDEDYTLFMLNTLGQTYNFSSRFNANSFIVADMRDDRFKCFIKESLNQGYKIKNRSGRNLYDISKIKNNERLYFDSRFLEDKSKLYVLHDSVMLKHPSNHKNVKLSSLSKWDSINIEDILFETSKLCSDENRLVVDFNYNKRNKYKIINSSGCFSITLEPGFTNHY